MVRFYSVAFGTQFREVDTFGIQSHLVEIDGITLKLVPIRDSVDFEGYPVHHQVPGQTPRLPVGIGEHLHPRGGRSGCPPGMVGRLSRRERGGSATSRGR